MASRNAATWLAKTLSKLGIDHVFFIDAIMRHTLIEMEKEGIKRIMVHSEKAAAYMADGYARITNGPGICMAQSVGAANIAAGLQDAYLAQSPVIAITGRKPLNYRHRNAYQELPHPPLFSALTKFSGDVNTAEDFPRVFAQAWRSALSGTPGPVHVDIDGLTGDRMEKGPLDDDVCSGISLTRAPLHRVVPDVQTIENAIARLRNAKRLAIVAGTGAMLSGAGPELLALAERLRAPVATSLGARGIIPTDHPLAIGTVGNYSAPPANKIVHDADVVFFVGSRTGDQVTLDWRVPTLSTPVVHLDIDPLELGRNYPDTIGLCGDPKASLAHILELMGEEERDPAYADFAARIMAEWRATLEATIADDSGAIKVERLCLEIGEALPGDGVLVADTGFASIWSCTCIDLNGKGQTYLRAAGSLGWAFPAALGVKCGAGDRPVVCFTGDGGFYYHLPELETARRYNIPVIVIINNNSGFGQSMSSIRAIQGDRPGNPEELYSFGPLNFAQVAESFGVAGIRVENARDLAGAIEKALAMKAPVVIDVVTDIGPRTPMPWKPDQT